MLGIEFTVIFISYLALKIKKLSEHNEKIVLITLSALGLLYKSAILLASSSDSTYSPLLFVEYKNYNYLIAAIVVNSATVLYLIHKFLYKTKLENVALLFALLSIPSDVGLALSLFLYSYFFSNKSSVETVWSGLFLTFIFLMSLFQINDYYYYYVLFGLGYLVAMAKVRKEQETKNLIFTALFIYFGLITQESVRLNIFQILAFAIPMFVLAFNSIFLNRVHDYWVKSFLVGIFSYALMQDQSSGLKSLLLFLLLGLILIDSKDWSQIKLANLGEKQNSILIIALTLFTVGIFSPSLFTLIWSESLGALTIILTGLVAISYARDVIRREDDKVTNNYKLVVIALLIVGTIVYNILLLIEYNIESVWPYSLGLIALFGIMAFSFLKIRQQFTQLFEKIFLRINNQDKYSFRDSSENVKKNSKTKVNIVKELVFPDLTTASKSALFYGIFIIAISLIIVLG